MKIILAFIVAEYVVTDYLVLLTLEAPSTNIV